MRNLFIFLMPDALFAYSGEQPPAPENPIAAVRVPTRAADRPAAPALQAPVRRHSPPIRCLAN